MRIIVENQGFCVTEYWFLNPFLKYASVFLFISPLISIFRVSFNPNITSKGRLQAFIPLVLKLISVWIATYLTQEPRPFDPRCRLDFQTLYAMPAPEIVWFESAWWLELLYGIPYSHVYENGIAFLSYSAYIGIVFLMSIVPVLVMITGSFTLKQFAVSFLISLLTIPLFFLLNKIHDKKVLQYHQTPIV